MDGFNAGESSLLDQSEAGPKDIMVFCDGTGKDGRSDTEHSTNVWRLYEYVSNGGKSDRYAPDRKLLYIPGIGSGEKSLSNMLVQIFGATAVRMVADAYAYIRKHYKHGDNIWLFGYSRGAYVARKVASLISRIGLVATEGELLARWIKHERPAPEAAAARTQHIPIKCVGVWDTVGAVYSPLTLKLKLDSFGIPDTDLPLNVQNAFHAVAIHENRKLFGVTLFEPNHTTNLKEIWFPGSHSDVGGGGDAITDLPDVSLLWMIEEMQVIAPLPKYDMIYPRATRLSSFIPTNECSEDALVMHGLMHQDPAPRPPLGSRYRKAIKYDIHESVYYLQGAARHNTQMKKAIDEFGWVNPVSRSRIVFCSAFERMKQAHMTALMTLKVQTVQRQIEDVQSRRESIHCRLPSVSVREVLSPSANRSGSASPALRVPSSDTILQITREQSLSQETDASEEVVRGGRENIDIMVFCDGEGDDGRAERATPTNVWRLYQLILSKDRPCRTRTLNGELSSTPKRLCLYMPGLLTLSKANNWEKDVVEPHDILVDRAYMRLAADYQPGDRIYLFGLSSGAAVVRKLAFVLNRLGVQRRISHAAFQRVGGDLSKLVGKDPVSVRCIGAWDTNRSCLSKDSILSMAETLCPTNVEHIYHALAIHENHRNRIPIPFKQNKISNLKEVWFPGSTRDVGGGRENNELWKISLLWMINELRRLTDIPHDDATFPSLQGLTLEPQDAFRSSPLYKQLFDHLELRRRPAKATIHAIVHTHLRVPTTDQPKMQEAEHTHLAYDIPPSGEASEETKKPGHPLQEPRVWARLFTSSRLLREF